MIWRDGQLIYDDKYKIEKELGSGGFGVTYLAMDIEKNRRVVIKTPYISVQNKDYNKYIERFKKEARILKDCCEHSDHIVKGFDFFQADGHYCLEMQYIAGESLWDYVQRQGALPEAEAVKYIRQIGLALVEVHKKGVLHLDVTPSNIMLNFDPANTNSGKAVLIDFGIAGGTSPPSTFSRSFGNKAFAPYELTQKGTRHATVDVYCLAASLYYAITRERPAKSYDRKDEQEELVSPKQLVPSLSDAVNQAILQGMALEANDRPQTMEEWLNLLSSSQANLTGVILASDVGVNYQTLENLLKAGEWKAADEETTRVMLKVAKIEQQDSLDFGYIREFPCTDLRTIDLLWIKYSKGHFGFSVQKGIWLECGGKAYSVGSPDAYHDFDTELSLGNSVGWRREDKWLSYSEHNFSLNAKKGHLPGHFSCGGERHLWIASFLASRVINCNL
ncbi:MAG: GUN4 domain-containing protein [Nostoc sp. EkiNYC01]|nr:serine/threonine-protein kinase [Nostoc sp. EkiNYC01]